MHSCPECGQACTCNGDIDDCFFEGTEEEMKCNHWRECEEELEYETEYDEAEAKPPKESGAASKDDGAEAKQPEDKGRGE